MDDPRLEQGLLDSRRSWWVPSVGFFLILRFGLGLREDIFNKKSGQRVAVAF